MYERKGAIYQKDEVVTSSLVLKTPLGNDQIQFTKCHPNPVKDIWEFI